MARKFHVNPETGEAGVCKAFIKECKFIETSEHFESLAEAEKAVQKTLDHLTVKSLRKKSGHVFGSQTLKNYAKLFSATERGRERGDRATYRDGRHERWQNFYKNLPLEPYKRALDIYYSESHSELINKYLWNGNDPAVFKNLPPEVEMTYYETIDTLDVYIKSMQRYAKPELLYKGSTVNSRVEYSTLLRELQALKVGTQLRFPGYTSTSVSVKKAKNFMYGRGVLYEIYSERGALMDSSVEEVLLERNSKFTYMGCEALDYGLLVKLKQEA